MSMLRNLVLVPHGDHAHYTKAMSANNGLPKTGSKKDRLVKPVSNADNICAHRRLTASGRQWANLVGQWLRDNRANVAYDRYYFSLSLAAAETAALLNLPGANWFYDPGNLSERDWGALNTLPESLQKEQFKAAAVKYPFDCLEWKPAGGESLRQMIGHVDYFLSDLDQTSTARPVLVVCSSDLMWAFRVRIERLSPLDFVQMAFPASSNGGDCVRQIIRYSCFNQTRRRDDPYLNWKLVVDPKVGSAGLPAEWNRIKRSCFTNDDLAGFVSP